MVRSEVLHVRETTHSMYILKSFINYLAMVVITLRTLLVKLFYYIHDKITAV